MSADVRGAPRHSQGDGEIAAPRRRVFLVGLYGVDNLGDDAIRLAVERAAPQLGAQVVRYAVRRPSALADPRAVRLRGRGWRAYLRAVRSADVVAIGGGGLLKDEGHGLLRGYGLLLELLVTALLARALGTRVVLLAIGVGPIHTRRGRLLVRAVAQLACLRQVRDEQSATVLRSLGVADVELVTDPTFTLLSDDQASDPNSGQVVFSVRHWFEHVPDRERRECALRRALARAGDLCAADGVGVRFANLYWPRDCDAAARVMEQMTADATALAGPLDWAGLQAQLRPGCALVAMRYHAVACAAMTGCPVIPVAYEPKVGSLAQALGLPYVDVEDPRFESRLAELVQSLLRHPELHRADAARLRELSDTAWAGVSRALR